MIGRLGAPPSEVFTTNGTGAKAAVIILLPFVSPHHLSLGGAVKNAALDDDVLASLLVAAKFLSKLPFKFLQFETTIERPPLMGVHFVPAWRNHMLTS
jgi:hypothetical protein